MPGINVALSGVAETALITLYARTLESERPDALIRDLKAAAIVSQLNFDFSGIRLHGHDEVAVILRLREFDRFVRDFLSRRPDGVVVHIGCGLDTRFDRVDNGRADWFDLDLPEVIDLRRSLLGGERERYHLVSGSILDSAWLGAVSLHRRLVDHVRQFGDDYAVLAALHLLDVRLRLDGHASAPRPIG